MDQAKPVSIMTIDGERQPQDFQNYDYILPHEHLVQNLTRYFTGSVQYSFFFSTNLHYRKTLLNKLNL